MIDEDGVEYFTREEAERLCRRLLYGNNTPGFPDKSAFHFGKCELVVLLDAIYGRDGDRIQELNHLWVPCPKCGESYDPERTPVNNCRRHGSFPLDKG